MRRHFIFFGIACLFALAVSACGSSGRDLRPPAENGVGPTRSTSSTSSIAISPALTPLTLASPSFNGGGAIPADFSCTGPSPALTWIGVPPTAKELVLIVTDPTADGFVHWIVTGIPAANGSVAKGQVPAGGTQLANSSGRLGWIGPCPPAAAVHNYDFILLALSEPSALAPNTPPKDAVAQLMPKASGGTSILTGTFQLGGPGGTGAATTLPRGSASPGTGATTTLKK